MIVIRFTFITSQNIRKTRIETCNYFCNTSSLQVSEHIRKTSWNLRPPVRMISSRGSQSNIQENRIETWGFRARIPCESQTSGKQVKLWPARLSTGISQTTSRKTRIETCNQYTLKRRCIYVSEQHPGKQGLKPVKCPGNLNIRRVSQSNIQENKDWNCKYA